MKHNLTVGQRVQHRVTGQYGVFIGAIALDPANDTVGVEFPDYPALKGKQYWYSPKDIDAID